MGCFNEEAKRRNLVGERSYGVEWTVGNDGRVAEEHMESRSEESTPLYRCVVDKLALWRYPRFPGERTNVSQRFEVKAKTRTQLYEWYRES